MLNIQIAWIKAWIKKHHILFSWIIGIVIAYITFPFGMIALPICLFITAKELLKIFAKEIANESKRDKP